MTKQALIIGAGAGLSACVARALKQDGYEIGLAARTLSKAEALTKEVDGASFTCDVSQPQDVAKLFHDFEAARGAPDVVVFNPSYRARGPLAELDPAEVLKALEVTAYGGFLVGQEAVKRMLPKGSGAILFTGASASVKGYAQSAPFAMGKFALRGLAQSMARELHPQGIHIAHFVIDGGISSADRPNPEGEPDKFLDPDAIAQTYMAVLKQHRSAWSWEIELRPWVENF